MLHAGFVARRRLRARSPRSRRSGASRSSSRTSTTTASRWAAADTPDGNVHAIRHTDVGGVQDLGALGGFGARSLATAIASDGAIGGQADRADGTAVFFGHRFTAASGRTEICPTSCAVWDLNARGQVVGLLPGRDPTVWQAFVHSPGGGLRAIGTLGGQRSSASAISEAGVVVGNAQLATSPPTDIGHAFIYDSRSQVPRCAT